VLVLQLPRNRARLVHRLENRLVLRRELSQLVTYGPLAPRRRYLQLRRLERR